MTQPTQHISLLTLQQIIKSSLEQHLAPSYWVVAEINEMKVNYSGHCYIELVEKGAGSVPRAKVGAVIWKNTFAMIEPQFLRQTGSRLASGLAVLMRIEVSYHELYGLSLIVREIDPAYTLGDMERTRRQTIEKLKQEALLERNKQLPQSDVIQRIAVVSSQKAAGYRDFVQELLHNEYGYTYQLSLFNAVVQGTEAELSIIEALLKVADRYEDFDVVVLLRGGGSQSDLSVFNSYPLCYTMASMPIPVITGIGHDKDVSVADMVAALSVKTPTALARHLLDRTVAFDNTLSSLLQYLHQIVKEHTSQQTLLLEQRSFELQRRTETLLEQQTQWFYRTEVSIQERSLSFLHKKESLLDWTKQEIQQRVRRGIETRQRVLSEKNDRLKTDGYKRFEYENMRLHQAALLADSFRPERIFKLGYAVVREGGKVLKSVDDTCVGNCIDISIEDGVLQTRIEKINKKRVS